MMALILAGGMGTRLHPFTFSIPKPLMPVGDVPMVEVVIQQLRASGFRKIVLALGHMSFFFTSFVEKWRSYGIDVTCTYETEPRGTAGSIALVSDFDGPLLVMNGDVLTTLDYRALIDFHKERDAFGTIAVSRRRVKIDYGVVRYSAAGLLDKYEEKPEIQYDVSMGINVLSRGCLDFIPRDGRFDLPDLMQAMRDAGKPVYCFPTDCYWQDIGRVEDLDRASADFTQDPGRFLPPN